MVFPSETTLRRATAADLAAIRALVLRAFLDPTQLRWQQFWVLTHGEEIIACGQLRQFGAVQELGSVVVASSWRRQGIGTAMVRHLVSQATQPLYLDCLGGQLREFYAKLGFRVMMRSQIPPDLRVRYGLLGILKRLGVPIFFMQYLGRSV
jgi:amino-acid N-acetyltransferase